MMTVSTISEFTLQPTEWLAKDYLHISQDAFEVVLNFTARHLASVPFAVFCVAQTIESLAKVLFFLFAMPFKKELGMEAAKEYGKSLGMALAIVPGMISPRATMNILNMLGIYITQTDKAVSTLISVKSGLNSIKTEGTVEDLAIEFAHFLSLKKQFEEVIGHIQSLETASLIPSESADLIAQMEVIRQKFLEKLGRDAGVFTVAAPPPPAGPAPEVRVIPTEARAGMAAVFAELQGFNRDNLDAAQRNDPLQMGAFDPAAVRAGLNKTDHGLWG